MARERERQEGRTGTEKWPFGPALPGAIEDPRPEGEGMALGPGVFDLKSPTSLFLLRIQSWTNNPPAPSFLVCLQVPHNKTLPFS